ncbi:amidoligase [Clostridium cochlearium]|uniref:amidoligase family protein n=1 Tax=Clostridium cochlearium TaxID=1494 RepID=UPI001459470F|nr:amidoligase family protein [Clostridium cochlearium]MBV1817155.1 amidoligase family protein [Bacteroidales bacterium MSK.15.36]MCG4579366.1 amidoligase family protein [Clostridium cochlearium]NME94446.1 amidoligase [Clostridium cochlearium]NSJ90473.1 amidoligase [Coprococcus sp. MSK.21.13]
MKNSDFLKTHFGIEIEMTGVTRNKASKVVSEILGGVIERQNDYYDTYKVIGADGRAWKLMYDASIYTQKKVNGRKVSAGKDYSVELVSPILTYEEDINTLQNIIRNLRKAGAFSEKQNCTGIHIHLDGTDHTPRSIRNFINIIYSRNDLLYESLQIEPARMRYCKKMDADLVKRINKKKPTTMKQIEDIWYEGYGATRQQHYHQSRYHFLNLHSFFNGVGTVELRGFNGTMHAGVIRSNIVLALALNNQALKQKSASTKKPQIENPKFAMRTWLNRIGFIGEDFKNCREHLIKHLSGSAAWRFRRAA